MLKKGKWSYGCYIAATVDMSFWIIGTFKAQIWINLTHVGKWLVINNVPMEHIFPYTPHIFPYTPHILPYTHHTTLYYHTHTSHHHHTIHHTHTSHHHHIIIYTHHTHQSSYHQTTYIAHKSNTFTHCCNRYKELVFWWKAQAGESTQQEVVVSISGIDVFVVSSNESLEADESCKFKTNPTFWFIWLTFQQTHWM